MMKKYLITSREFYTDTPAVFRSILRERLAKHTPDFALYRDKMNPRYSEQAEDFVEVCQQFIDIKCFIHSDVQLAHRLNAYGVHLTSNEFEKIRLAKDYGLNVVVSTHSLEDVIKAQNLGADMVTYSPIFSTPNKGKPKGIDDLQDLLAKVSIKVIALGGIVTQKEINLLKDIKVYGFASIRYFTD